jgi:hypothetical protein
MLREQNAELAKMQKEVHEKIEQINATFLIQHDELQINILGLEECQSRDCPAKPNQEKQQHPAIQKKQENQTNQSKHKKESKKKGKYKKGDNSQDAANMSITGDEGPPFKKSKF